MLDRAMEKACCPLRQRLKGVKIDAAWLTYRLEAKRAMGSFSLGFMA
jgi:hypothetical protein